MSGPLNSPNHSFLFYFQRIAGSAAIPATTALRVIGVDVPMSPLCYWLRFTGVCYHKPVSGRIVQGDLELIVALGDIIRCVTLTGRIDGPQTGSRTSG